MNFQKKIMHLVIKKFNKISASQKRIIIDNIYQSHKLYYKCFSKDIPKLRKIIYKLLIDNKSDLHNHKIYFYKNKLIGFCSLHKLKEYNQRLLNNLMVIFSTQSNKEIQISMKNIKKYSKKFQLMKNNANAFYLSRILILQKFQNKKFGSYILKRNVKNKKVFLHLKSNNLKGKKFYLKNRFKILSKKKQYILMSN